MAKEKVDKMAVLEQELAELRQKVAENEAKSLEATPHIQDEINKIRHSQRKKTPLNGIYVRESSDHTNVALYTRDGQKLGPFHPDNAERLLYDMAARNVVLTFSPPTQAQIENYKKTKEYKNYLEWEERRRARKTRSKKSGQLEKLATEIAKMSGTTVEAMNTLLKSSEAAKLLPRG